jgi:hypothetical protein
MVEEVLDAEGKVFYRAVHDVVEAGPEAAFGAPGAALRTVKREEAWLDESFKALQQDAESARPPMAGIEAPSVGPPRGGRGLGVQPPVAGFSRGLIVPLTSGASAHGWRPFSSIT